MGSVSEPRGKSKYSLICTGQQQSRNTTVLERKILQGGLTESFERLLSEAQYQENQ